MLPEDSKPIELVVTITNLDDKKPSKPPYALITAMVAVFGCLITAGQLAVTYYSYQSADNKARSDINKNSADITKGQADTSLSLIAFAFAHPKELAESRTFRELFLSMADQLGPSLGAQFRVAVLNAPLEKSVRKDVETRLSSQGKLPPTIFIHYNRTFSAPQIQKVNQLIAELRTHNYAAYEQSESVSNSYFMFFPKNSPAEAQLIHDTITGSLGISSESLMTKPDPTNNPKNYFGLWLATI